MIKLRKSKRSTEVNSVGTKLMGKDIIDFLCSQGIPIPYQPLCDSIMKQPLTDEMLLQFCYAALNILPPPIVNDKIANMNIPALSSRQAVCANNAIDAFINEDYGSAMFEFIDCIEDYGRGVYRVLTENEIILYRQVLSTFASILKKKIGINEFEKTKSKASSTISADNNNHFDLPVKLPSGLIHAIWEVPENLLKIQQRVNKTKVPENIDIQISDLKFEITLKPYGCFYIGRTKNARLALCLYDHQNFIDLTTFERENENE